MTALFGAAFFLIGAAVAQPIDIPAQDLKTALEEFVRQANVQLVYRIDDLSGHRSGAVTGEADSMAALMRLLKGTGLALRQDSSGAISVFQPVARPNASNIPAQSIENSNDLPSETVIVTGYRASLGRALEAKRESNGFRDSVMAEDIGKYPTSNVAESLVRIPGVVVVRDTRTDEGKSVTIRGLGSSYTIVTLNGNPIRIVTATSVGSNNRSVDIDGLSADLFSRVDFHKSPGASAASSTCAHPIRSITAWRGFPMRSGSPSTAIGRKPHRKAVFRSAISGGR
jgi:iron complex outermembrane recepter protein